MALRYLILASLAWVALPVRAAPPNLAFRPAGDGLFEFDTGKLTGRLKVDGKDQGLYPVVDVATGAELVHAPGIFSFYRVFANGERYGNAARDWPTVSTLLPDGAVELRWPAAEEHPLAMTGVYRWTSADTLDLEVSITPRQKMRRFELFMSSYFTKGFRASVFAKEGEGGRARFEPVDKTPSSGGRYVTFPRDAEALAMVRDGRWTIPPSPVDWDMRSWLAAPLAIRRDTSLGLTAVMMLRPEDCFAVSTPWNPESSEAGGYRSLYQSLFGRDLEAGQTVRAHCRLVIRRDTSDEWIVGEFDAFLKGPAITP
ncbi:MAG: hypothetical protein ACC628_12130 [Pirellulaceae bacterium]